MAEKEDSPGFNPVYDWLAEDRTLTSTEKLIIAHIHRRGKRGCYENEANFARFLGIDPRTLERAAKGLYEKEIITFGYHTKPKTWYVTTEFIKGKPVFDGLKGCGKPVSFGVKSLRMQQNQGWRFVRTGWRIAGLWGAFCRLFYRKKKDISYKDYRERRVKERREEISQAILDRRKKKKGKPTAEQFDESKRKLIEQTKKME